ncbi:tagaturonate epimerase family protein [Candidatus Aerophobetes bacterium]|nr:tagaturonate epimerase family protein [Candidatus Aerophobetes bacterium]
MYPSSAKRGADNFFFLIRDDNDKYLVIAGDSAVCARFDGEPSGTLQFNSNTLSLKVAYLNHHNLTVLQKFFPHLAPSTCSKRASFGTGDRLGVTTPAHIRAFKDRYTFPVLAQQSVRENSRTGRDFQKVLDDAIWGAFEAGYEGPFGADADHVKRIEDLKEAVDCGYTMFTIDPSDWVRSDIHRLSEEEKNLFYESFPEKKELERRYLNKRYAVEGEKVYFEEKSLRDIALTYFRAVQHVAESYEFLRGYKRNNFDFEVSVDETPFSTSPLAHIFVVEELHRRGVDFQNLALHFIGDWQKGIDYIGEVDKFAREMSLHASIARKFGAYKLSLHSGSDKFSVYPVFAKQTQGLFHIKTAGTSFLEAIKIVARKNPSLYREIHNFALTRFAEDTAAYHVTTDVSRIPDAEKVPDDNLDSLLQQPDSRQLIHITFGSVLRAKNSEGKFLFRDKIYATLFKYEDDYYKEVTTHIEKHLTLLEGSQGGK